MATARAVVVSTVWGGAVVSVVDQLELPVNVFGVGEKAGGRQSFDAKNFGEAFFPSSPQQ
jgi:signal recognition particle GTPase